MPSGNAAACLLSTRIMQARKGQIENSQAIYLQFEQQIFQAALQ